MESDGEFDDGLADPNRSIAVRARPIADRPDEAVEVGTKSTVEHLASGGVLDRFERPLVTGEIGPTGE